TLTSVFDHDRSIIFCSDRTWAQSCSRVALKILRRSLRTLPSCRRQSMASHSGTSSGPFTVTVSNLPFGSGGLISISVQRLTCPRQRPFGPSHQAGIRPVIRGSRRRGRPCRRGFLPPFGHRHSLVGHPVPPRSSAPLTVGLPGHQRLDPDGVSTFRTSESRPDWVPSLPRGQRCSHLRSHPSGRRSSPLPGVRSYP